MIAAAPLPVLALDQQQVMAGAAILYRERIDALNTAHVLDDDAAFHARVQRIARPLLAQAARDYPASADWPWEIHTTTDPEEHAYAMAGGKLLVSGAYVAEQGLSDAELAMVLAHEIAHAVLRHNLLEYEAAIRLEPAWAARPFAELEYAVDHDGALMAKLAPLGAEQELEADRAGLTLAARAGWPPQALAAYFHKLVQASGAPNAAGFAHPSPAARWRAARELARALTDGAR
jgi:predicted Zn-dependent protease